MKRTTWIGAVALLALFATAAVAPRDAILGEWHGTSLCTDRKAAPACNDEIVVYRFTPAGGDTARCAAYRITSGEEVPMGELDFTRNAKSGDWAAGLGTPRVHAIWSFHVADTLMTGTLTQVPSGAVVRRVRATRTTRH